MPKSARLLGHDFGRSAAQMNVLLKEHGYLDGEPGAYSVTDKGAQFARENDFDNGHGGFAHRQWSTRSWDDELADALRADMTTSEAAVSKPDVEGTVEVGPVSDAEADDFDFMSFDDTDDDDTDDDDTSQWTWTEIAVGAAIIVAVHAAPHVKPVWNQKVKPAAQRVRRRLTRGKPDDLQGDEAADQGE